MAVPEALELHRQLLRGLSVVHAKGLVLCDIKPASLFLARSNGGQVTLKILDFGIAKLQSAEAKSRMGVGAPSTQEGMVLGHHRVTKASAVRRRWGRDCSETLQRSCQAESTLFGGVLVRRGSISERPKG